MIGVDTRKAHRIPRFLSGLKSRHHLAGHAGKSV
ncbi:hypothetical protein AFE_2331 [Acidithiobacillus ferrooxidans ATCC 23270]|uniref:Uncharacterized protein n=1 Tax=Acidithiobacillus ferrooxidans (strain ATCC 23270 / DSM 14882 / CIP 104768 / NCIMB 8455) TaxID=243159 RepID=B7J699_ACIF2|nr:hypothetical protein AFE_2331 [Acidithiobacillus ferrooxidans ATCC 23270]